MMNHDVSHCADYDPEVCPKKCYRAQVTQDLRDNVKYFKDIPLSFAHFKGTQYCVKWPEK